MIGACDICNAQNVKLGHGYVAGLETYYCEGGCKLADTTECQRCHKQSKDVIWSGERTVCWDCAREIGFEDLRASGGIVGSP